MLSLLPSSDYQQLFAVNTMHLKMNCVFIIKEGGGGEEKEQEG